MQCRFVATIIHIYIYAHSSIYNYHISFHLSLSQFSRMSFEQHWSDRWQDIEKGRLPNVVYCTPMSQKVSEWLVNDGKWEKLMNGVNIGVKS